MSSHHTIGAPFTLASLSKSVRSSNGRVHATDVCRLKGIKKKEHPEIAIGLDGEEISIYNVQSPQLVTSYAFPPTASLTAAPYSIYRKGTSNTPSHRFTYASLTGSAPTDKSQLVCFHEKLLGDQSETIKTSYTHSEHPSQLLSLDSLPVKAGGSAKAATHDLIATFDNGDVICLSADLQTVRWVANLNLTVSSGEDRIELESVTLASAKDVTQGLLRSRGDVAAILNPVADEADELLELTQIICVIGSKPDGSRKIALLQVHSRSLDLPATFLSPLKHLLSWDLPQPLNSSTSKDATPHFILHASSGSLHILTESTLLSYNLVGTAPKLTSELQLPGPNVESFRRTSQDIIFTVSKGICRLLDVRFNALRAFLNLNSLSSSSTSRSKKRKNAESVTEEQGFQTCNLIAYYSDNGLMVAIRENEVLGIQLGPPRGRKRAKTDGTLLIDALGKGIDSKLTVSNDDASQNSKNVQSTLNQYVSEGNIATFEASFARELGIELEPADLENKKANEINGGPLTNSIGSKLPDEDAVVIDAAATELADDEIKSWKILETVPDGMQKRYYQYALYALRQIFCWSDLDSKSNFRKNSSAERTRGSLKMQFFPPNVFQWLLQTGYLTKECICRALLNETSENANLMFIIADGDIVEALVDFDPDLHILSAVLNYDRFLPVGEVVQAVKVLIQSIDDEPEQKVVIPKVLTNGTAPSEDEINVDIASELDAASEEIDRALSVLNHGLVVRSHALRPALIRLHTFPGPIRSSTLCSMLSRRDLESFMRLLHLELRNGGWTSSYDFASSEHVAAAASTDDPDDHAVTIIASLLCSTLDAIGAGAWIASVGNDSSVPESSEEILASLHQDTSEALNGFWEARYMRGLLSEFLRYASVAPEAPRDIAQKAQEQGKPFLVTGTLEDEAELPMLPLGSKADWRIEKTKRGLGGRKEERSKREMGMLISQRVPKYSFERIVI